MAGGALQLAHAGIVTEDGVEVESSPHALAQWPGQDDGETARRLTNPTHGVEFAGQDLSAAAAGEAAESDLIFYSGFEARRILPGAASREYDHWGVRNMAKQDYGINVVQRGEMMGTPSPRAGSYLARFEVRADGPAPATNSKGERKYRAELHKSKLFDEGDEIWLGWSIFIPSLAGPDHATVLQMGCRKVGKGQGPPFNLGPEKGRWSLVTKVDDGKQVHDLGDIVEDEWTDFVLHLRFTRGNDGIMEFWKDGEKLINYHERMTLPSFFGEVCGFAAGIYDPYASTARLGRMVVFHDEFRLGGADSSYEDVAPGPIRPVSRPSEPIELVVR